MEPAIAVNHLLLAAGLFGLSLACTWTMIRVRIMDIPNARSSHRQPVPRSGGVAIVVTTAVGLVIAQEAGILGSRGLGPLAGLALGAVAVAAVGLVDDIRRLRFWIKLIAQLLACALALGCGLVLHSVPLPVVGPVGLGWWGYPLTILWLVGLTNAFNFMDGLDGLAGGTAVIAALSLAVVAATLGSPTMVTLGVIVAAAALGFSVFNAAPARIFMGDVGSQFLGFTFAGLAVLGADHVAAGVPVLVVPLLLLHFMADTSLTFLRRLLRGERVTQAHRTHLYQLVNRLGYGHRAVAGLHWVFAAVQGAGALWLVSLPPDAQLVAFLPFAVAYAAYAVVVMRSAARAGLLAR